MHERDTLDPEAYCTSVYGPGTSWVTVIADLIRVCGVRVDEGRLRRAIAERTGASERAMRLTRPFDSKTDTAARNVRSIMSAIDLRWEVNDGEFVPRGEQQDV